MSLRPSGVIPDFAATVNFPAGPDPWAGQPTKADPGAALIAQGFTPHNRLAAEEMNWLLNKMGQWLRYQDTLEAQTWTAENDPSVIQNEPENVLIWSPELWRYFLAGLHTDNTNGRVYSSINGTTWDNDGAPNSAGQYQVCGGDPGGKLLVWLNSGSTSTNYFRTAVSTYVASANAAVQYQHCAKWIYDRWVIAGVGATHPTMKSLTPTDTLTTVTLPGAASVTGGIRELATDGTAFVALVEGTSDIYYGTVSGVTHVTPAFAGVPTGLVYVVPEALYWLVTDTGRVYTSPTGATWTLRYTASFTFPGGYATACGGITSLGGLVVAQVLVTVPGGTVAGLAVGIDKGRTWTLYPAPIGSPSGSGMAALGICPVENRVAFLRRKGVSGSDGVRLSYSLRVLA